MTTREALWTIDELGVQVALALAEGYAGQANGQVRDLPDRRSIRYYTTLGLIDRPAEMRGRTALYGTRHLLQIVAIKRMQARRLSLAEIQQELVGLTDSALRKLAQLPAKRENAPTAPEAPAAERGFRAAFWSETPAPVPDRPARTSKPVVPEIGNGSGGGMGSDRPTGLPPEPATSLQGIVLEEDATLLIRACRALDEKDVEAIRTVAAPLLKLLERRRLIRPRAERENP
jgi:DNA-binding transcriptional MerR regulator